MMCHAVHLRGGGLVCEEVCSAIDFEGIPIDDLTPQGFCKLNAQSRFAYPSGPSMT